MKENKENKENKKINKQVKYQLILNEESQEIDILFNVDKIRESDFLAGLAIVQLDLELFKQEGIPPDLLQQFLNFEYLIQKRIEQLRTVVELEIWPDKDHKEQQRKKNLLYVYNSIASELFHVYGQVVEPMTIDTVSELSLVQITDLKNVLVLKNKDLKLLSPNGDNNSIEM